MFEFTEKGESASNFLQNYVPESAVNTEEIPKPKIVKGMPPAFWKRLEEEYKQKVLKAQQEATAVKTEEH